MGVFQRYKDKDGNPTGKWFIRYPLGRNEAGKIIYQKMKVGDSKLQAKRVLAKKIAEFEEREKCGTEYIQDISFDKLVEWYLAHPAVKAKKTYDKDTQRSKTLLRHFDHLKVSKIKPYILEAYQQKRLNEISYRKSLVKPATINRELALMKRILNLAKRDGLVRENPCSQISLLPEENKRDRILSSVEFQRLISELREPVKSIVKIAYLTGMRKRELLTLTWDKVNLNEGYIDLDYEDTKTREKRRIYFNEELASIFKKTNKLRSIKHNSVFIRKNGNPVKSIRSAFELACKRAGIEDFVFHDLRHSFVTNMRKAGIDRTVIMEITGHKTGEMFFRYNTVDESDTREAMNQLSIFLEKQHEKVQEKSGTKVEHYVFSGKVSKKKDFTEPQNP